MSYAGYWRISTPHRWHSDSTATNVNIDCDLGGSTQTSNCGIFSGHNISTSILSLATGGYSWQYSDDDITYPSLHTQKWTSTDLPEATVWTTTSARRYWRLRLRDTGAFQVAPQIGHAIIGNKLEFSELLQPTFSAYDVSIDSDESVSENGDLVGSNINRVEKILDLSWDSPGLTETDFFNPASGLTFDGDFVTHAVDNGKPFYFVWDIDEDATGVWICTVRGFESPHVDTTARRRLFMRCHAWREVA